MIRLFVDDALSQGATVAPRPDQARYLTAVMRLTLGDGVLLFNGRDGEWRAVLSDVGKRGCTLICTSLARLQAQGPDLDLIIALIKRPRLETVVEKAAELGARRYSKGFELEADALGTEIAWRAGFDPMVGAQFFSRLPDPGNRFLGTHPPTGQRYEVVAQTMQTLR